MLFQEKAVPLHHQNKTSRSGAVVARWAHNPKVIGSNPFSATTAQALLELFSYMYIPIFFIKETIQKQLLVSDKTFLDNKKLGLVPFAGISPFWLSLFYHKLL